MSTEDEQTRILEDSFKEIQKQSFFMKRAMDSDSLKLALDHATEMLRELKTNALSPKNYYELYMKILDELRELEEYLMSLSRNGKSMVEVYEQVQSCANIVPRLYLLCCVGGVYISSKEAPAKDILKDLLEMIKGVQHPVRGLFLRNYLTLVSKNRLPDIGSPYEGFGGNIHDATSFLLQNFVETNRLWVRLQAKGSAKDKKKREKERLDLRILVGANLVRLSQLEGLDVNEYKSNLLPSILQEVIDCNDTIAQSYLMDCIIQVFPDDYHLTTLEPLLKACTSLKEKVNVRAILESLMNRLANHVLTNPSVIQTDTNAFKLFNDNIATLIEERTNMSLTETLRLQTVLTNFALKCYPSRLDYFSHCLTNAGTLIAKSDFVKVSETESGDSRSTDETTQQIETLLSAPLATLALKVLDIPAYSQLMSYLPWGNWKEVASNLLKSFIASNAVLAEMPQVEQLFKMITPLLRDRDAATSASLAAEEERDNTPLPQQFKDEQYLVGRLAHLMKADDTDTLLQIFVYARNQFTTGGSRRMQITYPPLVFAALRLARSVLAREKSVAQDPSLPAPTYSTRKVFHFVIEAITALATSHPEAAMHLFLQAAQSADECAFHAIAYEFVKEALLIYESEITDSRIQVQALVSFVGTLLQCKNFPSEDYEALITKVALYSNKLLKKSDQCRMVSLCSLLFWPNPVAARGAKEGNAEVSGNAYSDPDRVLECLQRALKIASASNPNLFVEILDRYIYYYENENPAIEVRYLSSLIGVIKEHFSSDPSSVLPAVAAHYNNTIGYIKNRQNAPEAEIAERFRAIEL
eukprot:gene6012-6622_t